MNEDNKKESSDKDSAITVAEKRNLVKQTTDIDGFLAKRHEFIEKVKAICVEGKDYHIIQGKKSLAKGGAEKIASIFNWVARFEKDSDAIDMLGNIAGLVAFKCVLEKGSKFVGEGRGSALLAKQGNDANKTLKMAQKSAYVDAVIRASGMSDFFTQDLEDMPVDSIGSFQSKPKEYSATPKQKAFILKLMTEKGYTLDSLADDGIVAGTPPSEVIEYLLNAKSKIGPNGQTDFDYMNEKMHQASEPIDLDAPEVQS